MKNDKVIHGVRWRLAFVLVLALLLVVSIQPNRIRAQSANGSFISAKELVRNGSFDFEKSGWTSQLWGTYVVDTGRHGPGLELDGTSLTNPPNYTYTLHRLHLPEQLTAADFSLDYRFVLHTSPALGGFAVSIVAFDESGEGELLVQPLVIEASNFPGTDWQAMNYTLTANEIAQINAAFAARKSVEIALELAADNLDVIIDNVSFRASGETSHRNIEGTIAFIEVNNRNKFTTIAVAEPDGSNRRSIWTSPQPEDDFLSDLSWNPEATELAFSARFEEFTSFFRYDAYAIRSDGSGLRKLTNAPSLAELRAGNFPKGEVVIALTNLSGFSASEIFPMLLYVQGALEAVPVNPIPNNGQTVEITVPNVADLGPGVEQSAVIIYSGPDNNCKGAHELLGGAIIDVKPGERVSAAMHFTGSCTRPEVAGVSWSPDGDWIGYAFSSFARVVPSSGHRNVGVELFGTFVGYVSDLAWSPVDNRVLYRFFNGSSSDGIYVNTVGGTINDQHQLVSDFVHDPAWLPDGNGFVYEESSDLYLYDFSSGQSTRLTYFRDYHESIEEPFVSPDGKHVVFERVNYGPSTAHREVWVLDLTNLVRMWPVTADGRSASPTWSKKKASVVSSVAQNAEYAQPASFALEQNYPNPFNPQTTIRFSLPQQGQVSLKVYDLLGKEVATLVSSELPAGSYQKVWDASGHASGLYLYKLEAGSHSETKRMNFVK